MTDYYMAVAKAYIDPEVDYQHIKDAVMNDIAADIADLQAQARAIASMPARKGETAAPTFPAPPASPTSPPLPMSSGSSGKALTEPEKQRIRGLWEAEKARSGRELPTADIIGVLREEGFPLDVGEPSLAVSTTIRHLRTKWNKAHGSAEAVA
jgi:hypothetical protein